jgi:hypothetical protein
MSINHSISIRSKHVVSHAAKGPAQPSLAQIKKAYEGDVEKHGYKLIADPESDKALKGTRLLNTYKATNGEGRNLNLVTDGDHDVYRGKAGDYLLLTYPEDNSRGDGIWAFDKTGNKLVAQGTALDGKIKKLSAPKARAPQPEIMGL